jgi:uncharacterized protein
MKRVLITGGTGFLGRKLTQELLARGDQVTVLTRDPKRANADLPNAARAAAWDPGKAGAWIEELGIVDAVVHLAGEGVARRWTPEVKARIEASRIDSTRLIVEGIALAKQKPEVLVSASATGYYGPHAPSVTVDESAPPGTDYLATVCDRWEAAAREVEKLGVRAAQVRIGVVLGEGGGALEKMIPSFKLFLGGPMGDGTQIVPWVHRDDVVGLILLAIDTPEAKGPINAVSPNPASSKELAAAIGAVLHRPSWLAVPAFALKLAMGDAASILLTGQRVQPKRAIELGYEFQRARLVPALESILAPE